MVLDEPLREPVQVHLLLAGRTFGSLPTVAHPSLPACARRPNGPGPGLHFEDEHAGDPHHHQVELRELVGPDLDHHVGAERKAPVEAPAQRADEYLLAPLTLLLKPTLPPIPQRAQQGFEQEGQPLRDGAFQPVEVLLPFSVLFGRNSGVEPRVTRGLLMADLGRCTPPPIPSTGRYRGEAGKVRRQLRQHLRFVAGMKRL